VGKGFPLRELKTRKWVAWVLSHPVLAAIIGLLALLVALEIAVLSARPRLDRDWVEHLAITPTVDVRNEGFSVTPVTDWTYAGTEEPAGKAYTAFSADFADLRNVWFVVEPHPGLRPMAHTLVLFEFEGDRMVGLTIEARREAKEDYSALRGAFNAFELAYIWSTPRDLLTRRAVMLEHDVLVYPLALTPAQKDTFLRDLLAETQALARRPRFYNTLFSNCTNELAKTAKLPWNYAFVLTGYSAEQLHRMKLIPGDNMADVRRNALLSAELRSWASLPSAQFDTALLQRLRTGAPAMSASR
jgi:hypothetical protein